MIELKNFTKLSCEESIMVLSWRNSPKVAPFMYNALISPKEHLEFLESLKTTCNKEYFLVYKGAIPIGVIDFINIQIGNSCEFGIYANPNLKGYGVILMETLLDYAFNTLKVKELKAQVQSENIKAINLYSKFGFKNVCKKIINNKKMNLIKLDSVFYSGGGGNNLLVAPFSSSLVA
ncbi:MULTISPECIES: UDP-4-amino-4,6-dideoxy-N-acetyl-beta-L-altrosamine N-acetyltransferase [Helicobacter]|uniref:UDP-4-amino-4, 6-dideoxy-N-acetyl-beta-L-altrosamine N-acetyltransferase n=1 Tax=Helicobacter ibis TaxID=2962633 RepID=A0ABT4VFB3_9HELI|nr:MULTISPECIES: UDP-4-amino-4,6-dideoxy-N-acetyl-beta-L-altrosamine N-acetyltransferase [Helicobacter]MDA3967671.1 UDP-4-amino-4,6-dideoxy-N-acetyl-beta-L-altrosamine N-acetyltransferase [Helicobacter sp. WB40]MDA3969389.1 UDP-4-amino-4,6-dideoxy-N-acetyl-beta-L-altrosamine N-acetyltransferase [Helicobacter ibis]